jgi:NAD+ kinase
MVTLELAVDDEPVTAYACDGMIIATPTGSTGHSLSAGGPLLHPQTAAFVINVICPHTLSTRPLVVADRSTISVRVSAASKQLLFSVDGVEHPLGQGDRIEMRRSPHHVRFAHLPGYSYFAVLRQKLHWRGSSLL